MGLTFVGRHTVTAEAAGQGEFAEFVTHHVFGNKDVSELFAVMHFERVSDKGWQDHRGARPSFDRLLDFLTVHLFDFLDELGAAERPFFDGAWHDISGSLRGIKVSDK